jgi:hypothetical protein
MTRAEVEAVIWQEAHRLSMHRPKAVRAAAMDRILAAADAYAAGDSDTVQAARREVLRRERADIGGRQGAASCTP